MSARVEIFCDGACRGNPGPGGWGVLLRFRGHEKRLYGANPATTNNRMELTAVLQGLRALTRPSRVSVTTDSQYVRNGITSWIKGWRARGWKTADKSPVKNQDLWLAIDQEASQHDVEWFWVKGHAGHPENELADALANRAIDEMLESGEKAPASVSR